MALPPTEASFSVQTWRAVAPVGEARDQFERGGVDPVGVFQDQQHRFGFAAVNDLIGQKRKQRRLALRGIE